MDMEHISRSKNSRHICLEMFIHHSAFCPVIQSHTIVQLKFIFMNQSHRKYQGITLVFLFSSRNMS